MQIVAADATTAELEKKASDYEEEAQQKSDAIATHLREKAKLCRDWTAVLKSGKWTS